MIGSMNRQGGVDVIKNGKQQPEKYEACNFSFSSN